MMHAFKLAYIHTCFLAACLMQRTSPEAAAYDCLPGNYPVGSSCVTCSKPPAKPSEQYSFYCGAVCGKGNWGLHCDQTCNPGCNNTLCNRWTSHCIQGCRETYHGKSCDRQCTQCEYCDDHEGDIKCVCIKGYYGDICQRTCPASCGNNTCTSDGTCNQSCIGRCVRDLCYENGSCIEGCRDGVWAKMCDVPCQKGCLQNKCLPSNGACVLGCITGWYGDKCDIECPGHCPRGCRIDGSCLSCSQGNTEHPCNMTCPTSCHTCHQDIQQCTSCRPGHYGHLCQLHCKNCLTGDCDILTGSCASGCIGGWYGDLCNMSCPENCQDVTGCHHISGRCFHGCKGGFHGARCESKCSPGCKEGRCETDRGRCVGGCSGSLYGAYCNNSCSSHCINTRCVHVENTDTVLCTEGCGDGWRGPYCQEPEEFPHLILLIASIVCLVVVTICIVCVFLRIKESLCLKKKRKSLYLTAINRSATYSTELNTSLVTTWITDLSSDTDNMMIIRAYNDSMAGYEAVENCNANTVPERIKMQHWDDTLSVHEEELYMEIPDSHFT